MQVHLKKKQESVVDRLVIFKARLVQPNCIALISYDYGKEEGLCSHLRPTLSRCGVFMAYEEAKYSEFKW